MNISIIYGLLIIKVSTDLICDCKKVKRSNLKTLESRANNKNTEPFVKKKKLNKNGVNGVLKNDLDGNNKGTPTTEDSGNQKNLKSKPSFLKRLKSKFLSKLFNRKGNKKKNEKKEKEHEKKSKPTEPVPNETKGAFTLDDDSIEYIDGYTPPPPSKTEPVKKEDVENKEEKKEKTENPSKNGDKKKKGKFLSRVMELFKKPVRKIKEAVNKRVKKKPTSLLEIGNTKGITDSLVNTQTGPRGTSGKSKSNLMSILMNTPIKKATPKVTTPAKPATDEGKSSKQTDLEDQFDLSAALDPPLAKSESPDTVKVEDKPKNDNPSPAPSKEMTLDDVLAKIDLDSGDKDDKGAKTSGKKELKGFSKFEDINPANKTDFKEKIVDENTTMDKEFKKQLGGGEFEGTINYYKGREKTREGGTKSKETTIYVPRDPSEDWNNSGLAASLRYLGSGYDIVFGNPLGDPVVMMDQGYRNPVIKLNWDVEYLNKDGANLKEPHGSWVRPEFSCRQAETIDHINTVEDFKKELSVDAQASYGIPYFFSFSASTGYKNFVQSTATNKVRTYITKTYCLRYVAGIVNYHGMETTDEFKKAISKLPEFFDSEACTLELFKSNEDDPLCVNTVKPWVQFIKMFGTHFTTIVHLGGKITHQIQINKSDVLSMQQTGVNVDMAIKAAISPSLLDNLQGGLKTESDTFQRSQSEHFKYDKQVLVIGGDSLVDSKDLSSLNNWTKDLYKKPMPIKIKLESIKSLLTDEKQRESFEEALKFYSETYGVSPDEIYKKYGKEFGVASQILKGHQVVYSGSRSGSAVCPNKTVIIMGFTLTILRKKNFIGKNDFTVHISHCPVGEEKCIVSNDQGSESRIWAVCGEDTIPLLNQQTSVSMGQPANATCPPGYSIAFGFGLSIPKGNIVLKTDSYPCRSATASCVHKSADAKATNAVWIACVENGAPELNDISNNMVSTSSRQCSSKSQVNDYNDVLCPPNSKLIAGWSMDFTETNNQSLNQMNKCSKGTAGCKVDKLMANEGQCRSHYSWIACLNNQSNTNTNGENKDNGNNKNNQNDSSDKDNTNNNNGSSNNTDNNNKQNKTQ